MLHKNNACCCLRWLWFLVWIDDNHGWQFDPRQVGRGKPFGHAVKRVPGGVLGHRSEHLGHAELALDVGLQGSRMAGVGPAKVGEDLRHVLDHHVEGGSLVGRVKQGQGHQGGARNVRLNVRVR